jgi:hypothetical protein
MNQIATFLSPALSEEADFWSRWAGARFVTDQFSDRFRLECALLDALGPMMPEEAVETLAAARVATARAAEELVAAGRRRATRVLTARLARRFIDQLALWCVEVELITSRIQATGLPRPAIRLLTRLRLAHALWQ